MRERAVGRDVGVQDSRVAGGESVATVCGVRIEDVPVVVAQPDPGDRIDRSACVRLVVAVVETCIETGADVVGLPPGVDRNA